MFILNQTTVYYLKRLASHARAKYKRRFRLTDENEVIDLLVFSSKSHDIETKRDFMLFYINCPEEFRDQLEETYSIFPPIKNMVHIAKAV